ncbi:MAG TPA: phosphotransferase, partial [Bacilli bacterium]|nr:phosphotransferase [Bacilli bacterium]
EPSRLALLHYDYCMRNLMLTPERDAIRGLFDFEAVRFGDALYDAVKLTFNEIPDDPEGCRAYLEGYIEAGGHPMDWERFRLYQAINGIGAMAWVDKWEEEFASRHQEFREKGRRVLVESMSG